MKRGCVLLNSGGLDSVTLLGILSEDWAVHSLFVDYGQAMKAKEAESAEYFALQGAAGHDVITVNYPELAKRGYIEARNTWLLGFALAQAEIVGVDRICVAFRKSDHAAYSQDQSPKYLRRFNRLTKYATHQKLKIVTPFHKIPNSKIIVEEGYKYWGDEIARTVSCTESIDGRSCYHCKKCITREKLFAELNREYGWNLASPIGSM